MTLNVSEQAQPEAIQALSGTQKAPLLDFGGLKEAEIGALLRDFHLKEVKGLKGTLEILSFKDKRFSPLMRLWFKGRQDSEIKVSFGGGQEYIRVQPMHPLYPHISAAYKARTVAAYRTKLRLKARAEAVKARAAASNGVAA
ncbi:gp16 [Xylella phage Xfas53]|uniref:gp16 n=1 Tax=Xylella phage Xfas53 TaxID=670252 RepID=UPI0001B60FD9|nr:gp16 [Xylella phage Xfas53]ACV41116.1 gp16 [Xylella phage Xfas53]